MEKDDLLKLLDLTGKEASNDEARDVAITPNDSHGFPCFVTKPGMIVCEGRFPGA